MANSQMATIEVLLYDNSPGPVNWGALPPESSDGHPFTTNSHANNSATAAYPAGYKIGYQDETNNGPCILAYMKYRAGGVTLTAGHICSFHTTYATTAAGWFNITNDGDDGMLAPCAYVALEAVTDTYWSWFWCGGVAPSDYISAFTADDILILTDDNVDQESLLEMKDANGDPDDLIIFKPVATTYQACGIAVAADD